MIELSEHFTYRKLLKFTFPSIIMLVVSSVYGVIDGLFVSNCLGKTPFTAVNFIFPYLMILSSIGFMFGTGGSALIAKTMGEGNHKKANEIFSLLVYVSLGCGVVLMILGIASIRAVSSFLGAEGQLLEDSVTYGGIYLLGLPGCVLQYEFQCFCATAGKPKMGLYVTVAAGVTNLVLDALFVVVLPWGLVGAAVASALSQCVGGFCPILYFARKNKSLLRLTKTKYDGKALMRACCNGASELLNNVSMSLVSVLYNVQLIRYIGEDGVAAYGVLMYVTLVFLAIFIGFSVGTAPIISYQYGAQNHRELKGLLKKSLVIIGISSFAMFLSGELLARPLSRLYTGYDAGLFQITLHGFLIYSFSFLFSGLAIFGSAFFTALNNGVVSALISTLRTLGFQVVTVLIFPLIWKEDGIWLSIVMAELLAALVAVIFLACKRKKYQY